MKRSYPLLALIKVRVWTLMLDAHLFSFLFFFPFFLYSDFLLPLSFCLYAHPTRTRTRTRTPAPSTTHISGYGPSRALACIRSAVARCLGVILSAAVARGHEARDSSQNFKTYFYCFKVSG